VAAAGLGGGFAAAAIDTYSTTASCRQVERMWVPPLPFPGHSSTSCARWRHRLYCWMTRWGCRERYYCSRERHRHLQYLSTGSLERGWCSWRRRREHENDSRLLRRESKHRTFAVCMTALDFSSVQMPWTQTKNSNGTMP
jgi:hypothetical protein